MILSCLLSKIKVFKVFYQQYIPSLRQAVLNQIRPNILHYIIPGLDPDQAKNFAQYYPWLTLKKFLIMFRTTLSENPSPSYNLQL